MKTVHFEFDLSDEEAEDFAGILRDAYLHAVDSSRNEEVEPAVRAWWSGRAEYLRDLANHITGSSSRITAGSQLTESRKQR